MLVLTRNTTQTITIGDHLVLTLVSVQRRGSVTLRIGNSEHELARGYAAEIEPGVTIKLLEVTAGRATFGIQAPKRIAVHRGEVYARIQAERAAVALQQSMPERVGTAICGVFVALSTWLVSILLGVA